MNEFDSHIKYFMIGISLIVNFLLSWAVLPLAIPPWHGYTVQEFFEVLLWQGMGAIGWPLAIFGGLANMLLSGSTANCADLLLVLIYPAMLSLLIVIVVSRRARKLALLLLHALLSLSFAVVWYQVLNGVEFMAG
jgi:hypothetical protein